MTQFHARQWHDGGVDIVLATSTVDVHTRNALADVLKWNGSIKVVETF